MSAIAHVRREPEAPHAFLGRLALSVLDRVLPALEGGTLVVDLPDGRVRRFGAGPELGVRVANSKLFRRLATRGKLGLGESYTAGEWETDDLVAFFELLLRNGTAFGQRHARLRRVIEARPRRNRRTPAHRTRRNIRYHYDLGNDLFALFLDPSMTYSCAEFAHDGEDLEEAQRRKLRGACDALELGPDDHVLEIGCGWGSLALTAAGEYGARVTGVTISSAQAALARERIAAAGLADRVEIVERDFRELEGSFTKVASIEMVEAIGEKLLPEYFATVDRVLASGGRAFVQTILVPDERFDRYRQTPDWIERYVFPGCLIPSIGALERALAPTSLRLVRRTDIGPHYAETLKRWRERFLANVDRVRALGYDERFVRTWHFYLAYCEAAFRLRSLHDAQLVLAR